MSEDEVGKPIFGKDTGRNVLSAANIAREAGVSEQAMEWAIQRMLDMGIVVAVFSPLCRTCGTVVGDYPAPQMIPDVVECPGCGQHHHVSELDLRMGYTVIRDPGK